MYCIDMRILRCARWMLVTGVALGFSGVATAQSWTRQWPAGTAPAPRYSAGQAYDAAHDRLVLFGGENLTPLPRPIDVWLLTDATYVGATPAWVQLLPTGESPLGREGGSVLYAPASNRIIVFGGCTADCAPASSDTWVLSNANGLGGTPAWTRLTASGALLRTFHAAAYDEADNRLIVFGGQEAYFGTDQNDVRVLDNADGSGASAPSWQTLATQGTAPAVRESAAVVYDGVNQRLILFGGTTRPNATTAIEHNDVWVLTHANGEGGTPTWIELTPSGALPPGRSWHSLHYDAASNRLIVFGGVQEGPDDQRLQQTYFNDVWLLTHANGLGGTPQWVQLAPAGAIPDGRSGHSGAYDPASDTLIVTMGRNDTLSQLFNDVWGLTGGMHLAQQAIDIKPGASPNIIDTKGRAIIPVAVLTSATFDATTVDPASVRCGASGVEAAAIGWSAQDVDGDGDLDLVLQFKTQALGTRCGQTTATLTGRTFVGEGFFASDSILPLSCD